MHYQRAILLYIENRNGNSDAKTFQKDTLERVFKLLDTKQPKRIKHFRADSASYQYGVVTFLQEKTDYFYIGCKNSYVEKYFSQIDNWEVMEDKNGSLEVGKTNCKTYRKNPSFKKIF